jgi:hypothetical protein
MAIFFTPAVRTWSEEEFKERGRVALTVRGPDGQPLKSAVVVVTTKSHHGPGFAEKLKQKPTTDDKGQVEFEWPAGIWQLRLQVKDVGYGFTGMLEVFPDKTTKTELPPLAPCGVLAGRIEGWQKGMTVTATSSGYDFPIEPVETQDGEFRMTLSSGLYWVRADHGAQRRVAISKGRVTLFPGQTTRTILYPVDKEVEKANEEKFVLQYSQAEREKIVTWAQGIVKDQEGKPVQSATVYALAIYHGGMRMYEDVIKTNTDANGRYVLSGKNHTSAFSATLIAHQADRPAAWGHIQGMETKVDFVLPAKGGQMEVTAVFDGKPAAGTSVWLLREGGNLRDMWAKGGGSEIRREMEDIAQPLAVTGDDGVAKFSNLLPGRYYVTAIKAGAKDNATRSWRERGFRPSGQEGMILAEAEGVPVRLDETTIYRMLLQTEPKKVMAEVWRHDGKPLSGDHVSIEFAQAASGSGWSTGTRLDDKGIGQCRANEVGLWRQTFTYRDGDMRSSPVREPYYSAFAIIAASPSLTCVEEPVRLTATRFISGTVSVELKGLDGKPARGVVEIGSSSFEPTMAGSTEETGVLEFRNLPQCRYVVKGSMPGIKCVDLGEWDAEAPLPDDAELLACCLAVRGKPIRVSSNTTQRVMLQPEPVGYTRGWVVLPEGAKTKDYYVQVGSQPDFDSGTRTHYRPDTGEFVAGPLLSGQMTVCVRQHNSRRLCATQEVQIEAGKVTSMKIVVTHPVPVQESSSENAMMGMNGISVQGAGSNRLKGKVCLTDGKTPALGAQVLLFDRFEWQPRVGGVVDAEGAIRPRGLWMTNDTDGATEEGMVVVAWLPGAQGAAVLPIKDESQELNLVLPPPVSLTGKVAVGGRSPAGQPYRIRVLAACQGRGRLNNFLSVHTTAQEDGTYELAGLTPGEYLVQAALDDIWLSPSVSIKVADKPLDPITLAIGTPGGPVRVKIADQAGRPLPLQELTLDRPAGPLADALWPKVWRADGAGEVYVPALEEGRHMLRIGGIQKEIIALPLPVTKASVVEVRVERPDKRAER